MVSPAVVFIVVFAGALAVLAGVVVGMYVLRGFVSPSQRENLGAGDPRRTCYWEDFWCRFGMFLFVFFVLLALAVACVVLYTPGSNIKG
jgi:hypothetical protein